MNNQKEPVWKYVFVSFITLILVLLVIVSVTTPNPNYPWIIKAMFVFSLSMIGVAFVSEGITHRKRAKESAEKLLRQRKYFDKLSLHMVLLQEEDLGTHYFVLRNPVGIYYCTMLLDMIKELYPYLELLIHNADISYNPLSMGAPDKNVLKVASSEGPFNEKAFRMFAEVFIQNEGVMSTSFMVNSITVELVNPKAISNVASNSDGKKDIIKPHNPLHSLDAFIDRCWDSVTCLCQWVVGKLNGLTCIFVSSKKVKSVNPEPQCDQPKAPVEDDGCTSDPDVQEGIEEFYLQLDEDSPKGTETAPKPADGSEK